MHSCVIRLKDEDQMEKKPTVMVVGTRGFPGIQGGVETHCQELYPRLAREGCNVVVFRRTPFLGQDVSRSYHGVSFRDLWCPRSKYLEAIFHTTLGVLQAALEGPDLVHIHAVGPALCTPLARLLGLRVVVTSQGADYRRPKWGWLARRVMKLGEKWAARYAHRLIVVGEHIRRRMKKEYGAEATVIPNGVKIPHRPIGDDLVKQWGLEPGKYVFALGRFEEEKGFDHLLDAFAGLDVDWNLALAGDAQHASDFSRTLKSRARRSDRIVYTGVVKGKALDQLFDNCGLFVLPSHHEGLPLVLLEALSYGCSVLVSDIPACRMIPLPEKRYCPDGDVPRWRKKMEYWIRHGIDEGEKRSNLRMLEETFNWNIIAERTMELYREAMGGDPTGPSRS